MVISRLFCTLLLLNFFAPWVFFIAPTTSFPWYMRLNCRFSVRASCSGGHYYLCYHYPSALSALYLKIGIPVDEIYGDELYECPNFNGLQRLDHMTGYQNNSPGNGHQDKVLVLASTRGWQILQWFHFHQNSCSNDISIESESLKWYTK